MWLIDALGFRKARAGGYVLSVADVAAREGVTERMVRYWCENGYMMPAVKFGKFWAIGPKYFLASGIRHQTAPADPHRREPTPGRGVGRPKGAKNRKKDEH